MVIIIEILLCDIILYMHLNGDNIRQRLCF